jgi:RND family efflux transporter MFP subunit
MKPIHNATGGFFDLRPLQRKGSAALAKAAWLLVLAAGCQQGDSYVEPPRAKVTVQTPIRRAVTSYVEFTGTTKAQETVDLRARVKGFLKDRHFDEKTPVKKDQLLFLIDEEPFQVALAMAKAKLDEAIAAVTKAEQSKSKEVATAQLALDQASLGLARVEEKRTRNLVSRGAGTPESLDQAEATRRKAEAQVEADKANLDQVNADYVTNILSAKAHAEAAKADARDAEINLGYCRITAPFDGWVSRRLFDVGNLVGDGQASVLATIYKDNPIYAYCSVSERDLLMFRELAKAGKHKSYDKGETIPLGLSLGDEQGFPHAGVLDYSDPSIDPMSGTVQARGIFDNPDRMIIPGLFVRVRVEKTVNPDALLVPEEALLTDQGGRYLLLVKPDDVVERRNVAVGEQEGGLRVIEANLKPDDRVIVKGLQRARPEQKVEVLTPKEVKPPVSTASRDSQP